MFAQRDLVVRAREFLCLWRHLRSSDRRQSSGSDRCPVNPRWAFRYSAVHRPASLSYSFARAPDQFRKAGYGIFVITGGRLPAALGVASVGLEIPYALNDPAFPLPNLDHQSARSRFWHVSVVQVCGTDCAPTACATQAAYGYGHSRRRPGWPTSEAPGALRSCVSPVGSRREPGDGGLRCSSDNGGAVLERCLQLGASAGIAHGPAG
jgi:hypothetical protein